MAPPPPRSYAPPRSDPSAPLSPDEMAPDDGFEDDADEGADSAFGHAAMGQGPAPARSRSRAFANEWTEEDLSTLASGDVWNMREIPSENMSRKYPLAQLVIRMTVRWNNTVYYVSGGPWDLNSTIHAFGNLLGPIVDGQGQYIAEMWYRRPDGGLGRKLTSKVIYPTQIPPERYRVQQWDLDSAKMPTDALAAHLQWRMQNKGRFVRAAMGADPRTTAQGPDDGQGYDPQGPDGGQGYDPQGYDPQSPDDGQGSYQQTQGYPVPPPGYPPQPGYAPPGYPPQPGYAPPGYPAQPGFSPYAPQGYPAPPGFAPFTPPGFGAIQPYQQPGGLATIPGQPPPGTEGPNGEDVWTPQGWTMSAKRRRELDREAREERERAERERLAREDKERLERLILEAAKPKDNPIAQTLVALASGVPTFLTAFMQTSAQNNDRREREDRERREAERRERDDRDRKDREDRDRKDRDERERRDREEKERREERERRDREEKERLTKEREDRLNYEARLAKQAAEEKQRLADERDREAARFAAMQRLELARTQATPGQDPVMRALTSQVQELRASLANATNAGGTKELLNQIKQARELLSATGMQLPSGVASDIARVADADANDVAAVITAARPTVDKIIDGISMMIATRNDAKAAASPGGFVPGVGGILIGAATAMIGGKNVEIPAGLVALPTGEFLTPDAYQQRFHAEQMAAAQRAQQIVQQQQAFGANYGFNPAPYALPPQPFAAPAQFAAPADPYGGLPLTLPGPQQYVPTPAPFTPPQSVPHYEPQAVAVPLPAPPPPPPVAPPPPVPAPFVPAHAPAAAPAEPLGADVPRLAPQQLALTLDEGSTTADGGPLDGSEEEEPDEPDDDEPDDDEGEGGDGNPT